MKRTLELVLALLVVGVVAFAFQKRATVTALEQRRELLAQEVESLNGTLALLEDTVERLRKENSEEKRLLEESSAELTRLEEEEKELRKKVGDAKTVREAVDGLHRELEKTEESLKNVGRSK